MTSGCAKQEIVKKDEGIAVPPVAKQAEQPRSAATTASQAAASPGIQVAPPTGPAQQTLKASSSATLQSALERIYFDFDSATLSESARDTLTKNAAALKKESAPTVRIEGNCDERGSAEYRINRPGVW